MLGAVREKGFIPWDDDVDLVLMRDEYTKLVGVIQKTDFPKGIIFDDYTSQHPAVCMKRTGKPPVFLDIIIYDFITENKILQSAKKLVSIFFLGICKTPTTYEISKRGFFKGWKFCVICMLYHIGRLFSMKRKVAFANYFHSHYLLGSKKLIYRSNDQYVGLLVVLPSIYMEHFQSVDFENAKFMITKNAHDVLASSYGSDYMTPKKSTTEQIAAHNVYRRDI